MKDKAIIIYKTNYFNRKVYNLLQHALLRKGHRGSLKKRFRYEFQEKIINVFWNMFLYAGVLTVYAVEVQVHELEY